MCASVACVFPSYASLAFLTFCLQLRNYMKVVNKGHDAMQNGEDHYDSIVRETAALMKLLSEVKKDPVTGEEWDGYTRVYKHGLMEIVPAAPQTLAAIAALDGYFVRGDDEATHADDGSIEDLNGEVGDPEADVDSGLDTDVDVAGNDVDDEEDEVDLGQGNINMRHGKNMNTVRSNLFDVSTWSETEDEDYKASGSSDSDDDMDSQESDDDGE